MQRAKDEKKKRLNQLQLKYQTQDPNSEIANKLPELQKSFLVQDLKLIDISYQKTIEDEENRHALKLKEFEWSAIDFPDTLFKTLDGYKKSSTKRILSGAQRVQYKTLKQDYLLKNENKGLSSLKLAQKICTENNFVYRPISLMVYDTSMWIKNYYTNYFINIWRVLRQVRYWSWKDWIKIPIFGTPFWLWLLMFVGVAFAAGFNVIQANILTGIGVLFVLSMIIGEITRRIPVWKTYFGSATIGCFIIGSIIFTYAANGANKGGVVGTATHDFYLQLESIHKFFVGATGGNFLNLYIVVLLVGAILTLPRKLITSSIGSYAGLILSGTVLAVVVGFGVSRWLGLSDSYTFLVIQAPLLSDGNGGGVQPLSQIAAQTGFASDAMGNSIRNVAGATNAYLGTALAVSSVSNVIVIILAAVLYVFIGNHPKLSGNGKLICKTVFVPKETMQSSDRHVAISLGLFAVIYVFSTLIEKLIANATISSQFPKGVIIANFAWAILIAMVLNLLNIIPKPIIHASGRLQKFFTQQFTWFLMVGIGLGTNLQAFGAVFLDNGRTITIIIIMDLMLLIGPWIFSGLLRTYPFESIITAGMCMGAQGGAGSIATLSAAKRMELLPYSQITCRIAGSLILVIASPIFSIYAGQGIHYALLSNDSAGIIHVSNGVINHLLS